MDAQVEVTLNGDVVELVGEIDCSNVHDLAQQLLTIVPGRAGSLVLDLGGVRYLDSTGIRMLFDLADRLDVARQSLLLVVPEPSPLRRLLTITHVESVAEILVPHDPRIPRTQGARTAEAG